ncbi:MAG: hypothetical protein ACRDE5_15660, partial [Ginsengibacter sp.]
MPITSIAIVSIMTGIVCSLIILIDVIIRPQKMNIMNVVWPVTCLYAGPLGLTAYYTIGVKSVKKKIHGKQEMNDMHSRHNKKSSWQSVTVSTLHCGSGCTLG